MLPSRPPSTRPDLRHLKRRDDIANALKRCAAEALRDDPRATALAHDTDQCVTYRRLCHDVGDVAEQPRREPTAYVLELSVADAQREQLVRAAEREGERDREKKQDQEADDEVHVLSLDPRGGRWKLL
jgi:hypothetical protein